MGFDWSFHKALSLVFDDLFQSLNPVPEQDLELLESDIVPKVCQCLDYPIHISKSPIPQCCLGPSKKPEIAGASVRRIREMGQALALVRMCEKFGLWSFLSACHSVRASAIRFALFAALSS
jgi:hypothetical protein